MLTHAITQHQNPTQHFHSRLQLQVPKFQNEFPHNLAHPAFHPGFNRIFHQWFGSLSFVQKPFTPKCQIIWPVYHHNRISGFMFHHVFRNPSTDVVPFPIQSSWPTDRFAVLGLGALLHFRPFAPDVASLQDVLSLPGYLPPLQVQNLRHKEESELGNRNHLLVELNSPSDFEKNNILKHYVILMLLCNSGVISMFWEPSY